MFLSVPREHSFLAFLVLTIFGQHKGAVSLVEELAKIPEILHNVVAFHARISVCL